MRIGMIAGESSGDQLGAALITALRGHWPDLEIEGIAGEQMQAAGCRALESIDELSIIGFVEVLRRYPQLRRLRERVIEHFLADPPDLFVGIDAPEFNLEVEERLRGQGVMTVHYVSPTVWAWRRNRLKKIERAVDLMLTLFPFEAAYYRAHGVQVEFVGHPKADEIALQSDRAGARESLALPADPPIIALLPGSRKSEWRYLIKPFLETAVWCKAQRSELEFVVPLMGERGRRWFENMHARVTPQLDVFRYDGQAQALMAASDVVLAASGTAALEAMLLKRPMVIAYRMAWLNYWLLRRMVDIEHFSLPNLLAGESLVPEFIQDQVRPEVLGAALLAWLDDPRRVQVSQAAFLALHKTLKQSASQRAAQAIYSLKHAAGS
jgi:lipid-A-disaccharide synthase